MKTEIYFPLVHLHLKTVILNILLLQPLKALCYIERDMPVIIKVPFFVLI